MPYTEFHYTPTGTGVISGKEVLEQTEDAINDLGGQISGDVQTAIDTANNALNTANTASADAQNAVNTANTAYTAATNAQNTANAAQTTASNALTAAQNAQNDVNALGNRVTTAENNISQNTSDISGLTTRMGTAEGNITNLQNDVITAQGSATSAQNTATLAREQAYVTRYTNTAVSDNSTVAYSDLNNTDNIKIGDFILDVNGKLFAITAVDTANETVSVTTPLTQLAVDISVIHKSGNETKSGELTLNDTLNTSNIIPNSNNTYECGSSSNIWKDLYSYHGYFRGDQQGDEYSSNTRTNLTLLSNRDTLDESGILFDTYRQNTAQGTGIHILGISIKENSVRYEGCRFGWYWDNSLNGYYLDFKPTIQGAYQAVKHNLGTSTEKWDTINGINPGSLSLPDLDNGIDISSYIDVTQTSQYTAPANGYISICGYASSNNAILIQDHDYNFAQTARAVQTSLGSTTYLVFPVNKNHTYDISCNAVTNIQYAYFYPCQGNV